MQKSAALSPVFSSGCIAKQADCRSALEPGAELLRSELQEQRTRWAVLDSLKPSGLDPDVPHQVNRQTGELRSLA
ncbi:hypothetical protein EYF80_036102 [Liparis tanakae]|uniref:Lipoprotein n=1 Tax=Liparis tanakae TaxID=230148 RepID=A0A4Z2GJQ1_9TELE|nr:hypothetical protein EYF80_036102 [Liparis tanakae]